jgi:hypothetical protein
LAARLEVCGSVDVSLALRPCGMGYREVHGHDFRVEACYCGEPGARIDVEKIVEAIGSRVKVRGYLDDITGVECSVIEDLLQALSKLLPKELGDARLCRLTATWLGGSRRVSLILGGEGVGQG